MTNLYEFLVIRRRFHAIVRLSVKDAHEMVWHGWTVLVVA